MNRKKSIILFLSFFLFPSVLFAETPTSSSPQDKSCDTKNLMPPPSAAGMAARPSIATPAKFPSYIKVLTNTDSVVLGPVGVAAACDETCKAYIEAFKQGGNIRKELDWMMKNASPSGRLYAALLIRRFDKVAGNQALESLKGETAPIYFSMGGCKLGERKAMSEHVKWILANPGFM